MWSGGGWSLVVGRLVELLVEGGSTLELLVEAGSTLEALIGTMLEALVEAVVTSSKASLRSRTWLVGVLQVKHPCCMQGEFLRQVF